MRGLWTTAQGRRGGHGQGVRPAGEGGDRRTVSTGTPMTYTMMHTTAMRAWKFQAASKHLSE